MRTACVAQTYVDTTIDVLRLKVLHHIANSFVRPHAVVSDWSRRKQLPEAKIRYVGTAELSTEPSHRSHPFLKLFPLFFFRCFVLSRDASNSFQEALCAFHTLLSAVVRSTQLRGIFTIIIAHIGPHHSLHEQFRI